MKPLHEAVRELRGEESQERFAHRVGVTRLTVAAWESGSTPELGNLRALVNTGLDDAYLLGDASSAKGRGAA